MKLTVKEFILKSFDIGMYHHKNIVKGYFGFIH